MFSIDKETAKSFIHSLIDIHNQILIFFFFLYMSINQYIIRTIFIRIYVKLFQWIKNDYIFNILNADSPPMDSNII